MLHLPVEGKSTFGYEGNVRGNCERSFDWELHETAPGHENLTHDFRVEGLGFSHENLTHDLSYTL